jgi:hypothetical protein
MLAHEPNQQESDARSKQSFTKLLSMHMHVCAVGISRRSDRHDQPF